MISVGVRELREDLSKLLQRVREDGEVIEITVRGEPVARVIPMRRQVRSPEEIEKIFADLDQLAAEISAYWQDDLDAVEAVREQRREL
jgi:prevent-host-death family protein